MTYIFQSAEWEAEAAHEIFSAKTVEDHSVSCQVEASSLHPFEFGTILSTKLHRDVVTKKQDTAYKISRMLQLIAKLGEKSYVVTITIRRSR